MAINEKIITGKKMRRFVDGAWERMSFWHKASDCEMNNGKNLEEEIQDIKDLIEDNNIANEDLKKQVLVYNKDTDYYQGYIEGQWKDVIYAGLNFDGYLIKDGVINDDFCGGLMTSQNIPVSDKNSLGDSIKPPYINSITMSNRLASDNTKVLNHLSCRTYCFSKTSQQGVAAGSIISTFPIRLDDYSTVTIDYKILRISTGKNTQILSFGFTKQPNNIWYAHSMHKSIYNFVSSTHGMSEMKTLQFDISDLNGYNYFTMGFINPNSTVSLIADIYNIKFE